MHKVVAVMLFAYKALYGPGGSHRRSQFGCKVLGEVLLLHGDLLEIDLASFADLGDRLGEG
jgi:hypothetical protein